MKQQTINIANRLAQRAGSTFDFARRQDPSGADKNGTGFHESSFDLRSGLEVSEAPVTALPEELVREFRRQRVA